MNLTALHLEEIESVMERTGMSRERILELRCLPSPPGDAPWQLVYEWTNANALAVEVNQRLVHGLLDRLGSRSRRHHDTRPGPVAGIGGGLHPDALRVGFGPCQRCATSGRLRLVGGRWLCDADARRQERRENFRQLLKDAA